MRFGLMKRLMVAVIDGSGHPLPGFQAAGSGTQAI